LCCSSFIWSVSLRRKSFCAGRDGIKGPKPASRARGLPRSAGLRSEAEGGKFHVELKLIPTDVYELGITGEPIFAYINLERFVYVWLISFEGKGIGQKYKVWQRPACLGQKEKRLPICRKGILRRQQTKRIIRKSWEEKPAVGETAPWSGAVPPVSNAYFYVGPGFSPACPN